MPVRDTDVGITEFLGVHQPFRGIVKQTVDDFIVNEVLLSGKIARLTQLARPAAPKINHESAVGTVRPIDIDSLPFETLDKLFPESISVADLIRSALQAGQTAVILPACTDKQTRTQIHLWVRENLVAYITDTVNIDGGPAVRLRRKDTCRPWKRRRVGADNAKAQNDAVQEDTYDPREGQSKRNRSLRVGPKTYVQFMLWKRNKDTTEALSILGKILHLPANAFTYAGTKDKRAITTQLVQVRGISEGRLAHANRVLQKRDGGVRSMAIGNVEPAPRGCSRSLGLGDLRGNRFSLALRDIELGKDDGNQNIMAGVESLRKWGFVNYYGLQRFGSGVSPTHETGFALLRGDFEEVCRRLLLPLRVEDEKEGMRPERQRVVTAMERFANGEITATELEKELPRWMYIERTIVRSFVNDEERGITKYDYKKAFGSLPRNLKKMYGHAVQSFLWNIMASERIQRSRPNASERMFAVEGDIIPKSENCFRDFSHSTAVRTVTKQEELDRSASVYRVVIPVLGSEVLLPDTDCSCEARKILQEQKINLKSKLSSEFGMKGTYRPLVRKPLDVEAKIVTYTDRSFKLIHSGPEELSDRKATEAVDEETVDLEKHGINSEIAANNVHESRTLQARELVRGRNNDNVHSKNGENSADKTDPHTIRQNNKEDQLKTENKRTTVPISPEGGTLTLNGDSARLLDERMDQKKTALVLSFTLGSAEYATMLVRELTRQDSSTANQKALQTDALEKCSASHRNQLT